MYTVMIVEDELLVRMGLNTSIPWESLEMQVIAAESNGTSAWESFRAKKPDIVLTDLRMPGMNGTELIRKIRESGFSCEIIVITCLEEFEILYQLMQMRITGYLLKATMSQEDILNLLQQAKKNLAEQRNLHMEPGTSSAKEELLKSFLFDHRDLARYQAECAQKAEPCADVRTILMVRMDVSSPKPILLPTIQKMVLDRISTFGVCVSFLNENQLIYAMMDGFNMECSELSASLLELARYSSDILGQKPRMVLFPVNPQGENLNAFWQLGQEILDEPFFYPDSLTTLNVDTPCVPKKLLKGIDVFQEQMKLIPWKSPKHKEQFFVRLQDLRSSLQNKDAFIQVATELADLYRFSFFGEHLSVPTDIQNHLAEAQSAQAVLELLSEQLLPTQMNSHCVYEKKMFETMHYIWEHTEESINLSSLADMVALSPNYYATLFKQTAGCSFSEYIGNVRIEKACKLLCSTDLPIKTIATLCGYSDMTYFIRFFKQKIGMPPHRWRREG